MDVTGGKGGRNREGRAGWIDGWREQQRGRGGAGDNEITTEESLK